MAQKKKPLQRRARAGDRELREALDQVEALMARKRWAEARALLDRLVTTHPQRPEVLRNVYRVAVALKDNRLLHFACERLQCLEPHDLDLPLLLAVAYLGNGWPALAVSTGRRALAANPASKRAEIVRAFIEKHEPVMADMVAVHGLEGADGMECLVMHERVRAHLALGKYVKALEAAEQLIARQPRFGPAYNNGAEACFHDGKIAKAIALTESVLAFEPDNVAALSNLVRFLAVSGGMAAARERAQRLKELDATTRNGAAKQAEALAWIGDDAGVLTVFDKAERMGPGPDPADQAILSHLAAVAVFHKGDEGAARAHWQAALRAVPGFEPAQGNLDDLKQPAGKRNAPWTRGFTSVVPKKLVAGLVSQLKSARDSDQDRARAAQAYVGAHPELEGFVPVLLAISDGPGREFAVRLATLVRTPAMLEAARDFALSERGPDAMRIRAAHLAEMENATARDFGKSRAENPQRPAAGTRTDGPGR